jgi:hypothetical protein
MGDLFANPTFRVVAGIVGALLLFGIIVWNQHRGSALLKKGSSLDLSGK